MVHSLREEAAMQQTPAPIRERDLLEPVSECLRDIARRLNRRR